MPPLNEIARLDRDQLFADWAQPARLESVQEVYNPASGQRDLAVTVFNVTVVVGSLSQDRSQVTAANHTEQEISLLLKSEELPQQFSWPSGRILFAGCRYSIHAITESSLAGTLHLVARPV